MTAPAGLIRPTDAAAIRQARNLVAGARYGALAVLEAGTGHPGASRVALATDADGTPLILVSDLAWHTRALVEDPRCSVLLGEPGRGDPLAYPRITLFARAELLDRAGAAGQRARRRYLARQPKAALYVDFGDFHLVRLGLERASFNAGFGKAFELTAADLSTHGDCAGVAALEAEVIERSNRELDRRGESSWRVVTLDSEGVDLLGDGQLRRLWFDSPLTAARDLPDALARLLAAHLPQENSQ